jgi:hypothetical protein
MYYSLFLALSKGSPKISSQMIRPIEKMSDFYVHPFLVRTYSGAMYRRSCN